MDNNITYNEIIDILAHNGVDIDYIKLELTNINRTKKPFKLLSVNIINNLIKKIKKIISKNPSKKNNVVHIFTDGSCIENDSKHPGTFGLVVIYNNKIIFEYSNHDYIATNNTMELSAVIIASQIGNAISRLGVRTTIYTDSQYTMNTLYGTWNGKANKIYKEMFNNLCVNKNYIKCEWAKAHNGLIGNEYADKLCELEYNRINGYYVTRRK